MMDWYFSHDVGELVVPKDQEYFDRLPSPDSWSQWGVCEFGNSGWPNNYDSCKIANLPGEILHQLERECSSSIGGSLDDSLSRNSTRSCRPDQHFSNLTGTDPTDDIFMSSLLQDDVLHNQRPLVSLPPQSRCAVMSAESDSTNRLLDFQSFSSDTDGVGSSKCFRTPPFSPSAASDNDHVSLSNLGYGNSSDQSNGPSVKIEDMIPCHQDSSIEESVLQGLEFVMSQLSDKTRLCFRDSLYRLAHRSKQEMSVETQQEEGFPSSKPVVLKTVPGQTRSARTETVELATNSIDRAVSNLMFNKVDVNVQDLLPAMSAKFVDFRDASSQVMGETFLSPESTKLLTDSQVPVLLRQKLSTYAN